MLELDETWKLLQSPTALPNLEFWLRLEFDRIRIQEKPGTTLKKKKQI